MTLDSLTTEFYIRLKGEKWNSSFERLGVRIPAATDLSRKKIQAVTPSLLNARQQVWILRVLGGDDHPKRKDRVTVCLFELDFSSQSRIFHSYGDVTITGEGLQNLTYARHSWTNEQWVFFACHTNCDTGHSF